MDAYQQYCSSNFGLRENEASVSSFYPKSIGMRILQYTVFTIIFGIGCDGFLKMKPNFFKTSKNTPDINNKINCEIIDPLTAYNENCRLYVPTIKK